MNYFCNFLFCVSCVGAGASLGAVEADTSTPTQIHATQQMHHTQQMHRTQMAEALRAANHARSARRESEAAWATERHALQIVITETKRQTAVLRQQHETDQAQVVVLEQDVSQWSARAGDSALFDQHIAHLTATLEQSLDTLSERFPSSVIPVTGTPTADASADFAQACARVHSAQQACAQWQVSLSSGYMASAGIGTGVGVGADGHAEPLIYDQLRMGAVAAWWSARDGSAAGMVQRRDGKNILHTATPSEQAAIAQAFALARGHVAPSLLTLPCIPIAADDVRWQR